MKKYILLLFTAILFFSACEEIPPKVTGSMGGGTGGGGSNVEDQLRNVIVEEFTGVRCVNCPAGSALIADLLASHGERLIAVSIHAGEFSNPYSASLYDFRTPDGNQLLSYLGEPFGYPTAVVNRKLFSGQFDLQLGSGDWAGYVVSEKEIAPKVRIDIEPTFNPTSRSLSVKVSLYVDEAITEPNVRLSLLLTENGIKDLQLTPSSSTPQADYSHKHVLRDFISNYDGDPIGEPLYVGAVVVKNFNYTLPADWKEDNCRLIAMVGLSGASKDVLQAYEVHVVE